MTIASTTNRKTFAGDDITTSFGTSPVVFFNTSDLVAQVVTNATGAATTLTENTHYTVSGGAGTTGTVNLSGGTSPHGALATGTTLVILRVVPLTQAVDFVNNDINDAEVLEDALDKLTMIDQQQQETLNRAIALPSSESGTMTLPVLADRASSYLAFDANGDPIASPGTVGSPTTAFMATVLDDATAAAALSTLGVSAFIQTLLDDTTSNAALTTLTATRAEASAVAVPVLTKLREVVSVKDFGATGDGTTDDAAAITAAVASGRKVFFPAGTYLIKSAIAFSTLSNFALFGEGPGLSIIKCDAAAVFTGVALSFSTCNHFSVSGLTIDQNNNTSFTATYPLVQATSCTDFSIEGNEVIHFTYIGLAVDSCQRFWVRKNRIERDATINTVNYCINVSSSISSAGPGVVEANLCKNAGSVYTGKNIVIASNRFDVNGYGAGIVTGGDGTSAKGAYVVIGNIVTGGTGVDVDGTYVAGMEIDGYYCTVNNNLIYSNSGLGIAMLAFESTLHGNVCFGNGVGVGGAQYQAGIGMGYVSATHGAHRCNVSGNQCFDIGAGVQLYGYYEQSNLLIGIALQGNKFDHNTTGDVFLQGTAGFYETQNWTSYTPTVTATSGTITTVGTVDGRYKRIAKTVLWEARVQITTNGTGATKVQITLPSGPGNVAGGYYTCIGRAAGVANVALLGEFQSGAQTVLVQKYDGTYPGSNGEIIQISGFYEVA